MKTILALALATILASCTTTYKQTAAGDIEFSTIIIPVEQDSKK